MEEEIEVVDCKISCVCPKCGREFRKKETVPKTIKRLRVYCTLCLYKVRGVDGREYKLWEPKNAEE